MSIVRDTRSGRFRGVRGDRAGAKSYRSAPAARRSLDLDGCLAFGLLTSTLFILQLGAAGAGVFSGLVLLYGLLRGRELSRSFRWRAVLLAIPLLAILSAYWSEAAGQSLKLGVEYGLTAIAGLLLSASLRPKGVLIGTFLAFMVYLIASLLLGGAVAVGAGGDTAFAGLNQSKNLLGDICSTGALVSLALVVVFLSPAERNPWLAGLGAVGAAAEVVMLVSTRSSGAVAGLALGIVAFGVLVGLTAANRSTRAFLTVGLSVMAVAGGLLSQQISKLLVALGASAFNKDSTLTGRTYLWRRAHDLIAEKPWVGRGYSAFWVQGNPDAEGLWRYGGITERGGFNFHNTGLEILVQLGWIGLTIFALVAITAMAALVVRFVVNPSVVVCFWLALLAYELVRMPIESIGLVPYYFATVLLFASLGFAFSPEKAGRRGGDRLIPAQSRRRSGGAGPSVQP